MIWSGYLVEEAEHVVQLRDEGLHGLEEGVLVPPQQLPHRARGEDALAARRHVGRDRVRQKAVLEFLHHRLRVRVCVRARACVCVRACGRGERATGEMKTLRRL